MSAPTLRPMTQDDVEIVKWVLYRAVDWDPAVTLPPEEVVLQHPQLVVFHEHWGRPGDIGVVAEVDGRLAGAAFCRLFTEERHGEGFIDEETPELGVAVDEAHRGTGIGTILMKELANLARRSGLHRLGLSVQKGNRAQHLYRRLGYEQVAEGDNDIVMVLDLTGA